MWHAERRRKGRQQEALPLENDEAANELDELFSNDPLDELWTSHDRSPAERMTTRVEPSTGTAVLDKAR